jgi:hypothetical protein
MMPLINKQFLNNVPKLLLEQDEWLTWYNKKKNDGAFTKPPLSKRGHTVKEDSPGCSIKQALEDTKYCGEHGGGVGFKMSDRHNLVFFDCDHVESLSDLPDDFKTFIEMQDTYMEWSPSGKGLRIAFKCLDKEKLPNKANLTNMDGELFVRSGHVTITGDHLAGEEIKEITAYQLEEWFGSKKAEVIDLPVENFKFPEFPLVIQALKLCKLDQCDRVKDAYKTITSQEYNHYDYWLKIISACHHYATVTNQLDEMTSAIVDWSQTDEMSYESDEDVINHWASLSNSDQSITYSTLFKFAKLLKFEWPNEVYDKNGATGKPMVNSPVNFKYLMDYFNIEFYRDIFNNSIYVKTGKDIINRFFLPFGDAKMHFGMAGPYTEENLNGIIWELATENGYTNVALGPIVQLFTVYIQKFSIMTNIFKVWLETDPDKLTDDMVEKNTDISKSNLDYLMSCIQLSDDQDVEMVKTFFNTLFFEMVMPIYNPQRILSQRSFMLILTGPEACRKTTFWSMLFPANLRRQLVTNSTETLGGAKSIRDFSASLVSSALVVVDEFEIFYNKKNDSLFKALVTSDVIDYVPIYEKTVRKEDKNAVLVGTTNKRSLPFEQDNNRRLALVDVKWIDTDAMLKINWHHFYRQYIVEGKKAMMNGLFPWKLDGKVLQKQYLENEGFRAQSNLEIVMREVFDFDMKSHDKVINYDKSGIQGNKEILKTTEVIGALKQRYPEINPGPAELRHLLKRLCGKYTNTSNQKILLKTSTNAFIQDGIVKQGQYTRYVMPPQLIDAF